MYDDVSLDLYGLMTNFDKFPIGIRANICKGRESRSTLSSESYSYLLGLFRGKFNVGGIKTKYETGQARVKSLKE